MMSFSPSTGQGKSSKLVEEPIFNANHDGLRIRGDDSGREGV